MALSRRDFFRRGLAEALRDAARTARESSPSPPLSPPPRRPVSVLRPPGAVAEAEFLTLCTRCDECLFACPMQAIRRTGPEHGAQVADTPTIVPEEQPCWLCGDLPCIAACTPGALVPLARPADVRMGRLRLREERCFSARGSACDVCVDRCPVEPRPIAVETGRAPLVDPGRCTGCGVCAWLCPASALEVLPSGASPEASPDEARG